MIIVATLEKVTGDIDRMFQQFNIKPISTIIDQLPWSRYLELDLVVAHRDLDIILKEKDWAIVSGRGPSGPLHLGHLMVFSFVAWLQKVFDVHVFIPLSDDEKFVFGKIDSLDSANHWAIDNARWIAALGFNPKKTHIYISSQHSWVYRYAIMISRHLTLSTVKNALGVSDSRNLGIPFYAAVQIAHILQPTLDFNFRTLVPIGLDQDVFMRLTRDVAEKLHIKKPASIYVKFLPGLQNIPMSSSIPETAIYVTDDDKTIYQKIMRAHSGGAISTAHQRKHGGQPNNCVIYEWFKFLYFKSKEETLAFAEACRSGQLICGYDCKPMIAEFISDYLSRLRERAEKLDLDKFIWKP